MKPPSRVVSAMPRSGIRRIMDLASQTPGVIRLDAGDPDFATPPHIVEAAARAAADGFTRYTPNAGIAEVREAFARKVAERNGLDAGGAEVMVTVGAIHALYLAVQVVCDPGDEVLIPDPGWPNYEMVARAGGFRPVRYPLVAERGFVPDFDAFERVASRPSAKVAIVNTPANPTGAVLGRSQQERLLDIVERYDLWVVSDECYEDIVFEGTHVSPASIAQSPRVVSVFSTSKSYAMTGWRVGYAVAPAPIVALMAKLTEAVTSCVTGVAQKAAQAAVEGDQHCVTDMRAAYRRRRDIAVAGLEAAGLAVTRPEGAFYVMANSADAGNDGYEVCRQLVTEHGVATAPGETFGPGGSGMIRLSFTAPDEDVRAGVERVVAALA